MSELPSHQVGDLTVTAVLDGQATLSFEILQGIGADDAKALLTRQGRPAEPDVQVFTYLIRGGGRTILVDAGAGERPGCGRLVQALGQAGSSVGEVDTVLLTHAHSDHVGGLFEADGSARFPKAHLEVAEPEIAFWSDESRRAAAPEGRRPSFDLARRAFDLYRPRLKSVTSGEVAPGVTLVPLPGHTPGHSGFRVGTGEAALLIWGDIVHFPAIQLARPEVTVGFDSDPDQAAETRRTILDKVQQERTLVAGMHLDEPGFLRIQPDGDGYKAVPA